VARSAGSIALQNDSIGSSQRVTPKPFCRSAREVASRSVKVLALYDVHGNVDGLDAVLADPRAADPDVVVVGGDAVPGPFARATLARLESLSCDVRWIRGNGTRLSPRERWTDALAEVEGALVVGGHTHQQDDRIVDGVRFINAGSVGLPYEGDGAARWLWIADGVPELRRTDYDNARAGERILAAGWPDERSVRAALIEPIEPIVVTRIFEGLEPG
jgi:predicted phosphodiesterase